MTSWRPRRIAAMLGLAGALFGGAVPNATEPGFNGYA